MKIQVITKVWPDKADTTKTIGWAEDGGRIHLMENPPLHHYGIRLRLEDTGRRMSNGKPIYKGFPEEVVLETKYRLLPQEREILEVVTVSPWHAAMGTSPTSFVERTSRRPQGSREVLGNTIIFFSLDEIQGEVAEVSRECFFEEEERPDYLGKTLRWVRTKKEPRHEDSQVARHPVKSVMGYRVGWPEKAGRVPAKISAETYVQAIVEMANGKLVSVETVWSKLSPETREQLLQPLPVCTRCNKNRLDSSRGFNACTQCMTLLEYGQVILPILQTLDPGVAISHDPTGQSLQFRFADLGVSHKFRSGYGFEWDETNVCLRAGKRNITKVWDRLRPTPISVIEEARPFVALLGLTLDVDPNDPRVVRLQGDWVKKIGGVYRKALGLKGSAKQGYAFHGVDALRVFVWSGLFSALTGCERFKYEYKTRAVAWEMFDLHVVNQPPPPPAGWKHGWWL